MNGLPWKIITTQNKIWFILWGKLFLFIPSLCAQPSLFFTEKELQAIHQKPLPQRLLKENISLSALVYVDEAHWVIWVNNQMIHSTDSQCLGNFHIERVTASHVEFFWKPPNVKTPINPIKFTLRPYQTYLSQENRILPP